MSRPRHALHAAVVFLLIPGAAQATPLAKLLAPPTIKLVEWISGLPSHKDVPIHELNTDEVIKELNAEMDKELTEVNLEAGVQLLSRFGYLPADVDLRKMYVDAMAHNAAAFYNPRTGAFYNVSRFGPLDLLNEPVVVAHELTHAVQDQALGAQAMFDARGDDDDRTRAMQWVMEGQATVVGNRAGNTLLSPAPGPLGYLWGDTGTMSMWSPSYRKMARMQMQATDKAAGLKTPPFLSDAMVSSYIDGSRVVWWLEKQRGKKVHKELMCRLPQSTEQLMHPHKYLKNEDPPRKVTMPELVGRKTVSALTMGEWGIEWLLRQARTYTPNQRPAAGWGGDRMALFDDGSAAWRVVMDDEKSAHRLARLLPAALFKSAPDAVVRQNGVEVDVITGPMAASADAVIAEMLRGEVTLHPADPEPPANSVCAN